MVVSIRYIKFLNPVRTFGGILLSDRLEDVWERSPKLHRLRGNFSLCKKLGIPLSGCANRLSMICGWSCTWVANVMQDILSLSPNIHTASAAGRRMINPSCALHCISLRTNPAISGVHAGAWGSFLIALSTASLDQGGHVLTRIPSSA